MTLWKTLATALVLLTVTLAGCSSEDDGGAHGFVIKSTPSDPVTGAFVFEAKVSGDSYEWDMGDGRPKQAGKSVEYVYGFTDGVIKPKLTVIKGGEATTYAPRTITLGSGENTAPDLVMAADWNWVTVGEPVTLTGARSSDPDGDPLLFSWFCQRTGDIRVVVPGGAHAHGGGVGGGFSSGGVDAIPSILLNGTDVPAPDTEPTEDLCDALLATSGTFTEDATVKGTFTERGIYKISMLARDPKTPSKPGSLTIYVADPSDPRPDGPVVHDFDGTFQVGYAKELDTFMAQTEQADSYIDDNGFRVHYPLQAFALEFDYDAGPSTQNMVTYHIVKPGGSFKDTAESTEDINRDDPANPYLDHGSSDYTLRVYGRQGADLSYSATITLTYETDPSLVFEDPAAH